MEDCGGLGGGRGGFDGGCALGGVSCKFPDMTKCKEIW